MEKININSLPLIKLLIFVIPFLTIGIQLPNSFTLWFMLFSSILGIISWLFRKHNFCYVLLSISIGLILSLNFRQAKTLKHTNHYKSINSKIFGKVIDYALFDTNKVLVNVSGYIHNEKIGKYNTSVQLAIYDSNPAVRMIEVGDYILCNSWIRLPRNSKLPTDPPELHIALINEIEFFGTVYSNGVVKIWKQKGTIRKLFQNLIVSFSEKLEAAFEPRSHPYFYALLLGNRKYLSLEQKEKFATTGMSHILALSGFHFGILATILFYLLSFLKNKWVKFLLISIALITYLVIVNLPPSGIRATIMILAFLLASMLERNVHFLNILGLILIIVLIFFPTTIFTIGFQLSFVAVLGIGLLHKKFYHFFINLLPIKNKLFLFFVSVLSLTLSAQVFTSPLVAYYFGYYTFISFFSNLVLLPIFTLSILFGFVTLFLSFVSLPLGKPFATTADFLLSLANDINDWIANKFETFVVTEEGVIILAIIISIAVLWVSAEKQPKLILAKFAFALSLVCLLVFNLKENKREGIEIYPRLKYVAVILKWKDKNYCLLLDRKPHQFPSNDKAMVEYLAKLKGRLLVGVSGNAGIAVSDALKAKRKITLIEVPSEVQKVISYAIFGDLSLFKK